MRIKKETLERIVREEFVKHLKSMMEAPETIDAGVDGKDREKKDAARKDKKPEPAKAAPQKANKKQEPAPKEVDVGADEADAPLEKDVATGGEDAANVTGSELSKDLENKTVQSLTMQPKSKILPGAQEIEIQFSNSPDPLKILINKTGTVKFFYKNQLRNTL